MTPPPHQRGDHDAAAVLADAVRHLMDASVLAETDELDRRIAADEVHAIAGRLSHGGYRVAMPRPDGDGMRPGERPYNPVIGAANPIAPPLTVAPADDGTVVGECMFRAIHEGPPDAVHGGWVATILDQVLGHAIAAAGVPGFTVELTVRYRRPTPYGVPLTVRGRTDSIEGRRVQASGEIVANGEVTAEATALFLRPAHHLTDLKEAGETSSVGGRLSGRP